MTRPDEDNLAHLGYAMVELPVEARANAEHLGDRARSLEELERQAAELDSEIGRAREDLAALESQAKGAVEAEDAEAVAGAWAEKRRFAERIASLEKRRAETSQAFAAVIAATWDLLRSERREADRLRADHDDALAQVVAAAEALLAAAKRLAGVRHEWSQREEACEAQLRRLEGRAPTVFRTGSPAATPPARAHAPAGPDLGRPERIAARRWSVYDPDAGRLVDSLSDLLKLLARWYPGLRTEQERVTQFLALPNAEPLPDRLRKELEQAGLV